MLPEALKELKIWCLWKAVPRQSGGGTRKEIYSAIHGGRASVSSPEDWADYRTAEELRRTQPRRYNGLAIAVPDPAPGEAGLVGIDVDHCRASGGGWSEAAERILAAFKGQYIEVSQSGKGLHIITRGRLPQEMQDAGLWSFNNHDAGVEMYFGRHFIALTGNTIPGGDTEPSEAAEAVAWCFQTYRTQSRAAVDLPAGDSGLSDDEIIRRASEARGAEKFKALFYDGLAGCEALGLYARGGAVDHSAADLGLLGILAYWTERNPEQMERLFDRSALAGREKWAQRADYRRRSIRSACRICSETRREAMQRRAYEDFEAGTGDTGTGWPLTDAQIYARIKALDPRENPAYRRGDDIAAGYLFADVFDSVARYEEQAGRWYVYNGRYWAKDGRALAVGELVKRFVRALCLYAAAPGADGNVDEEYYKRAQKLTGFRQRDQLIADARGRHRITAEDFDREPYLFNTENCVIDLRTGEQRAHDPALLLSQISGVTYWPEASAAEWEKFLSEVIVTKQDGPDGVPQYAPDREAIRYVQEILGAAMLGDGADESFYLLYGASTRNGKSTLLETVARVFGDNDRGYARQTEPETLAQTKRNSSGPTEDLARLAGCRLLRVSEIPREMLADAARLKKMTGRDTITARYLHEGSFQFILHCTLFINTNHLPVIGDDTLFTSGRVHVIPFLRHFSEDEQDIRLKDRLQSPENLSGILNWLLEGLRRYRERGGRFEIPGSVRRATEDYRADSDKLGAFMEECLQRMDTVKTGVPVGDAYEDYQRWCYAGGFGCESRKRFTQDLKDRGLYTELLKVQDPLGADGEPARDENGGDKWQRRVIPGYRTRPGLTW